MDCETFEILGRWEIDRGPQNLHYDFWWNLPRDYMVTSEWALPPQFENGIVPEDLLSNKYGHRIHFWVLRARRNVQTIDLGADHQDQAGAPKYTTYVPTLRGLGQGESLEQGRWDRRNRSTRADQIR